MTVSLAMVRRTSARAVFLALIVALIPLPLAASDNNALPKAPAVEKSPTLLASMAVIVARDVWSAPATLPVARRAQQGGVAGAESPRFFKTRAGIVVAALMIAGTGYALYSSRHDRITSAGKK